jgi:hypothetical protein
MRSKDGSPETVGRSQPENGKLRASATIASRRIVASAVEFPIFSQYSRPKMRLSRMILLGREECEEEQEGRGSPYE